MAASLIKLQEKEKNFDASIMLKDQRIMELEAGL